MLLGTADSLPEIDKNKRLIPSVNKKTSNIIATYRRSFFGSVVSIFQADVNTYLQCVVKIAFVVRLAIRARSEQEGDHDSIARSGFCRTIRHLQHRNKEPSRFHGWHVMHSLQCGKYPGPIPSWPKRTQPVAVEHTVAYKRDAQLRVVTYNARVANATKVLEKCPKIQRI